ncbi:MAG: hypothetical protein P1U40_05300 [Coxiellaceae bacterium]|nr:hypothetical protein [Coxiellaceae bacterium]
MKNILKTAVTVSCMLVGLSAMANVMTATRQVDGGTVAPNGSELRLELSGKILPYVLYNVTCHMGNPTADPVVLQAMGLEMVDVHGSILPTINVRVNGQYVQNQFALKAGDNVVRMGVVGVGSNAKGFISLRNLDDKASVTVSNCVANPVT